MLWFSNRRPYFSVHDVAKYSSLYPDSNIEVQKLRSLEFLQAAKWLTKRQDEWSRFLDQIPNEESKIKSLAGGITYWGDENYPQCFENLFCPPPLLMYRGDLDILEQLTVAVVGARTPTHLGRQWVQKNIPELIKKNIVVVSGGARGIDFEAHDSTLRAKGKTVSLLPGSIICPYPRTHSYLFEKMVQSGGLLLSEFVSTDAVRKENFHQRNRLIAACGDIVLIVEAKVQSGTMMTANKALTENKEVYVVPGHPLIENYEGSLKLLFQGAQPAISYQELIEGLSKKCFEKRWGVS